MLKVALCDVTIINSICGTWLIASQGFNRGNVAILLQDPGALRSSIVSPSLEDIEGVVFAGGALRMTREASLGRFPPAGACQ